MEKLKKSLISITVVVLLLSFINCSAFRFFFPKHELSKIADKPKSSEEKSSTNTYNYDISDEKEENAEFSNESQFITSDISIINIEWIVRVKESNNGNFNENFRNTDKENIIRSYAISVMADIIGNYEIDTLIYNDFNTNKDIENIFMNKLQESLTEIKSGLTVVDMVIKKLSLIDDPEVIKSYNEISEIKESKRSILEDAYNNLRREEESAKGEYDRIIQETQGHIQERINLNRSYIADAERALKLFDISPSNENVRNCRESIKFLYDKVNHRLDIKLDDIYKNLNLFEEE